MAWPNVATLFRNTQQVQFPQSGTGAPSGPQQGQPGQPGPTGVPGSSLQNNNPPKLGPDGKPVVENPNSSPLDAFTKLWETDPAKKPPGDPWADPLIPSDPAKIAEAAGKYDFTKLVPQELMTKVLAGNDPASLVQLVNTIAQQVMGLSAQLSTATANHAGVTTNKRIQDGLEGRFKDYQLDNFTPKNPALAHPAAKPMLKMLMAQIKMQNPNFPPDQITKMAEDYFTQWAGQFSAGNEELNANDPTKPKPPAEMDWTTFLPE